MTNNKNNENIVEAILLASEGFINSQKIASIINSVNTTSQKNGGAHITPTSENTNTETITPKKIEQIIPKLTKKYQQSQSSFTIIKRKSGWKICSLPEYAPYLKQLLPEEKPTPLSPAALETLAIIAYRQPITKSGIEKLRGVHSDATVNKLLDRQLIKTSGRADTPGKPQLYSVDKLFFDYLGIDSIEDIPNATELKQLKAQLELKKTSTITKGAPKYIHPS